MKVRLFDRKGEEVLKYDVGKIQLPDILQWCGKRYAYAAQLDFYRNEKPFIESDTLVLNINTVEFKECAKCRKKPGAPVLCDGCLRRRARWLRLFCTGEVYKEVK